MDLLERAVAAGVVGAAPPPAAGEDKPQFAAVPPPSAFAAYAADPPVDVTSRVQPAARAAVETPPLSTLSSASAAPAIIAEPREALQKAVSALSGSKEEPQSVEEAGGSPVPSAPQAAAALRAEPSPGRPSLPVRSSSSSGAAAGAHAGPSRQHASPAGSSASGLLAGRDLPTEKKFEDILRLLEQLEHHLLEPRDLAVVGQAYRDLKEWTRLHQCDQDLAQVLDMLHGRFPAWRRQALEEAYRLFFDDVAKERAVTRDLPEPPTSEEMGFRRLPDELFSADVAAGKAPFKGSFEDRSPCAMYIRRYEYQIQVSKCKGAQWHGRKIVQKEHVEKPFPCAGDLLGTALRRMIEVVVPIDQCCARRSEAPKACGPFFLPSDGRTPVRLPPEARPPQLPTPRAAKKPPREPCT